MKNSNLIDILNINDNDRVLIYDVHASESGALSILNDLYQQVVNYSNKSVKWTFVVSTPSFDEKENVIVKRFPWVKKSWFHRLFFDKFIGRRIIKRENPNIIFSLQNMCVKKSNGKQFVYLHLPFILTDYVFKIKRDGKRLWIYQNILSKVIFKSLKKADKVIVQTDWMKDALNKKGKIDKNKIVINYPKYDLSSVKKFVENKDNLFFYPATAFSYKNHITLLKAFKYIQDLGYNNYKAVLTLKPDQNSYTEGLYKYVKDNNLSVDFVGLISREKVFDLYSKSYLLFPSFVESFGLPLLEAKNANTNIIAADTPFAREILEGYSKASFFKADDYREMADKILKLIKK